jgi:hypothetical protein
MVAACGVRVRLEAHELERQDFYQRMKAHASSDRLDFAPFNTSAEDFAKMVLCF